MPSLIRIFAVTGLLWVQVTQANLASGVARTPDLPPGVTIRTTQEEGAAVDLGTTLVAIRYDKGVVVAADSRTSVSGFVSNRYAHKLAPLTAHNGVVLRSGSAADTQTLAQECRLYFRERALRFVGGRSSPTVAQMAHWMRQAVLQRLDETGGDTQASLLVAGYNHDDNNDSTEAAGPCIYSVALSGALMEEGNFAATGSGSVFVLGFLDHEIGQQASSLKETQAVQLCRRAISLAAHRDGSSGGVIRMCVIDQEGIRELTAQPVDVPADTTTTAAASSGGLAGFAPSAAFI